MAGSRVNHTCITVRRPLGAIGGSPASQRPSGLVWSGADDIVRGTETPPSWAISLSEDRDQGDRNCVHGRDLIAGSDTLRECFNNVDVGVPLWLTEPQDKSLCQEFASSHPSSLSFRILYCNLCAFTFFSVVSC